MTPLQIGLLKLVDAFYHSEIPAATRRILSTMPKDKRAQDARLTALQDVVLARLQPDKPAPAKLGTLPSVPSPATKDKPK